MLARPRNAPYSDTPKTAHLVTIPPHATPDGQNRTAHRGRWNASFTQDYTRAAARAQAKRGPGRAPAAAARPGVNALTRVEGGRRITVS